MLMENYHNIAMFACFDKSWFIVKAYVGYISYAEICFFLIHEFCILSTYCPTNIGHDVEENTEFTDLCTLM